MTLRTSVQGYQYPGLDNCISSRSIAQLFNTGHDIKLNTELHDKVISGS